VLNVAVIGVGSFGKNHVRVYSELENVRLAAVADPDEGHLKAAAKTGASCYLDYKEMLAKEQLDVVSVVVPTRLHHKIALEVIEAGINLLIEKPIASTVEEAQEIIEAAKAKNLKLTVGHIERFNPAIIELKKRLDKGELGRIYRVGVNRLGPFPTRVRDVGVVIDLAVHDLDIVRFLVGEEVEHLYARTEKKIHTNHEDFLAAILTFKNKTVCNLNIDWLTPAKVRKLFIAGEKGQFVADYLKQDLSFQENSYLENNISYSDIMRGVSVGKHIQFNIQKKEPLRAELEHFLECVENDKQPMISGEDGMKALELALDLIKSSNNNEVIIK
jgi:UDP-N-acetylglucosamine 3-dehydrogenase